MSDLGRKGRKTEGKKGVKSRMASMKPEQRKQFARKGAKARWGKPKPKQSP